MIKQNPFSIYDFFGYLIPGVVFTYLAYLTYSINDLVNNFEETCKKLITIDINSIFILLVVSYIVGHLLSFLSSITIERFSLWTLGYPSKYLLSLNTKVGIYAYKENKVGRFVLHTLTSITILPITFFNLLFGNFLGFNKIIAKSLDKHSCDFILGSMALSLNEKFNLSNDFFNDEEKDWFRVIYHYVVENSQPHLPKMQNYVALYGFTRTLSFVFCLLFWIIFIACFYVTVNLHIKIIALIVISLIAYIMYVDFNKFYRKFSLEAIMAYTVMNAKPKN